MRKAAVLCLLLMLSAFARASADGRAFGAPTAFSPGERLDFVLEWGGVGAGDATMEVFRETPPEGSESWRILSVTTSRTFVDLLYKVRNRFESYLDPATLATVKYVVQQKEGGRKRDFVLIYDQFRGEVTRLSKDKKGQSQSDMFTTVPGALDSLSALYVLRQQPLQVGDKVGLTVFEGKKTYVLQVEVEGREKVKVPAGTFETLKLHPRLEEEGIFRKQGEMWIWVTDDERHMPVLMKTKVKIGSVNAVLDRFTPGEGAELPVSPAGAPSLQAGSPSLSSPPIPAAEGNSSSPSQAP